MSYGVLGGGISGLTAAYYLKNFGIRSKITVIEGSHHLGGWINSYKNENGTLFEQGPRTLRVSGNAGANTLHLAEILKLEDKIIPISYDHVSTKNRMIKVDGKLNKLPNSLKSALTKLPPFSKPLLFHLLGDLFAPSVLSNDESFYSFAQRRFGEEVAKYAVDPLCRGVFAGNAKDLSVMALSKTIYNLEQEYKSVIKGMILDNKFSERIDMSLNCSLVDKAKKEKWSVWSLKGGLQTLVEAVEDQLHCDNVEIIKGATISKIKVEKNRAIVVTDEKTHIFDKVISCLPAVVLKDLVKEWKPFLHAILSQIPYVSVGLVNLEYSEKFDMEPAFGYLVPSSEPCKVLGVIFDTCTFPQEDKTVFTVMMGGYWFKELFGDDPSSEILLNTALKEIESTFNISAQPTSSKVNILRNCIPQYTVGHFERVTNAKKLLNNSPVYLAGNSYDGVGVNDAIYNTRKMVISSIDR